MTSRDFEDRRPDAADTSADGFHTMKPDAPTPDYVPPSGPPLTTAGLVATALSLGLLVAAALYGLFAFDQARGDDYLQFVDGSITEVLQPNCDWNIAFEVENISDAPLPLATARVFMTETAAQPIGKVVEPGATFSGMITHRLDLDDCTIGTNEIRHGDFEFHYIRPDDKNAIAGLKF